MKVYREGTEHGQWMGERTRWCAQCGARHRLEHEHFRGLPAADVQASVIGAGTPEELAEQARGAVAKGKGEKVERKTRQQIEKEAMVRVRRTNACRRLSRAEVGVLARYHDPRWRKLADSDIIELGEAWADVLEAFGVDFASKWLSPVMLLATHGELYMKITEELKEGE